MDDLQLIGIAWRLDHLRWVPTDVLTTIVTSDGACMTPAAGGPPNARGDREFAKRLCGGCPVQNECLELELRAAGAETVGVWGGMTDDDRRALYPHWLRRGDRTERGAR